ncbi:plasma-membrane choline transporter-domain-containing protein [Pelagophyceae sp. CCMP2097]|nr:plasma-membrane choline transporter-domain-containing protein [Pelagophyceae sp. CCMP2097]
MDWTVDPEAGPTAGVTQSPMRVVEVPDPVRAASATAKVEHPQEADWNPIKVPDIAFELAWLTCVIGTIAVACKYSGAANFDDDSKKRTVARMLPVIVIVLCSALAASSASLLLLLRLGTYAVHATLLVANGALVLAAVFAFSQELWFASAFLCGAALLGVTFWYCSRHLAGFASATMHVATDVVLAYPLLQLLGFLSALCAVLFFFASATAMLGYSRRTDKSGDKDAGGDTAVLFLLAFIFFWTCEVFKYALVSTTAGAAHAYWYGRRASLKRHPVLDAGLRAVTSNLGAVCFGAAVLAVVEAVLVVVHFLKRKAREAEGGCCVSCLLGCVGCCLGCCGAVMDYFNKYAFVYVGIHGYSFLYAGRQVVGLMSQQGMTAIGMDYFVETVLSLFAVGIGLLNAVFGLWLVRDAPDSWTEGLDHPDVVVGLIAGIGGYAVAQVVFSLVEGANKATFVLFLENPDVLAVTHPDMCTHLAKNWKLLGHEVPT